MDSLNNEIDLYPMLPPTVNKFEEFKEITKSQSTEFNKIRNHLIAIFKDRFVNDATEHGVRRWEKVLKLQPKSTDTLEDRKFRILAKMNNRLPYTMRVLEQRLNALCGQGNYQVFLDVENYELNFEFYKILSDLNFFKNSMEEMIPVNLVLNYAYVFKEKLEMNLFTGGIISTRNKIQIRPAAFKMPSIQQSKYYAGFISMRTKTTISEV